MASAESQRPAINLRVRSSYSNMQSAMSAKKMPAYALRALQPAIGLIHRKSLAGALEFANAARKEVVQPIIGCDFETEHGWLTLIAETASARKNLFRLARKQADKPEMQIDDDADSQNSARHIPHDGAQGPELSTLVQKNKET